MFIGYKVISCRKELMSLLEKLDKVGYIWRSQKPLCDAREVGYLEDFAKYGEVALAFSDSKEVGYCSAKYAKEHFGKKREE